jgi:hypothetical protein
VQRIKAQASQSNEWVRCLLAEMATLPASNDFTAADPIEGASLTPEQLAAVTELGLATFAEWVLQKNLYLANATEGEALKKADGQSFCDFLAFAIEQRVNEADTRLNRLAKSAKTSVFTDSTLEAIKQSVDLANRYKNLVSQYGSTGTSEFDAMKKSAIGANSAKCVANKFA